MTGRPRSRANREGSIFPYRNGCAAYVWVTTPAGERKRRWVYERTREDTRQVGQAPGQGRRGTHANRDTDRGGIPRLLAVGSD